MKIAQPTLLANRLGGSSSCPSPPQRVPARVSQPAFPRYPKAWRDRPRPSPPSQALARYYPGCPRYHPHGSNPITVWEFASPSPPAQAPARVSYPNRHASWVYPRPPPPSQAAARVSHPNQRAALVYPRSSPPSRAPARVSHPPAPSCLNCASPPPHPSWIIARLKPLSMLSSDDLAENTDHVASPTTSPRTGPRPPAEPGAVRRFFRWRNPGDVGSVWMAVWSAIELTGTESQVPESFLGEEYSLYSTSNPHPPLPPPSPTQHFAFRHPAHSREGDASSPTSFSSPFFLTQNLATGTCRHARLINIQNQGRTPPTRANLDLRAVEGIVRR